MKKSRNEKEILVAAGERDCRKRLSGLLPPGFWAREIALEETENATQLVDANAALVALEDQDGESGICSLESLLHLRAGSSLILVTRDLSDELLQDAIMRLQPRYVVAYPPRAPVLSMILDRALPDGESSRGARPGQRAASQLLGVSQAIHTVIEQIRQVADSRIPVLVLGETGTGKELVARAVHEQSGRASGPFVAVNCGAFPDSLLESELFGFERGAFSGAQRSKPGLFEQANGGTFFLDEIGDTTPALQVKLLRVLESKEIRRLGSNDVRPLDVRIVSATHRDLEAAAAQGSFRQDLYFRLNTASIYIPPLRRRRVDIPFLAQHFAETLGEENARRITLNDGFLQSLERREFPGNVRELRNAVERAIALAEPGEALSARHLQQPGEESAISRETKVGTLKSQVEQLESEIIREALARFAGNRTHAAEALGLSRLGLRQKIKRLGLEPGSDR